MFLGRADDLDRAVTSGLLCSECGCQFTKPHGHPVACHYCWKLLSIAERETLARAVHHEANRVAHQAEGRKQKQARIARRVDNG